MAGLGSSIAQGATVGTAIGGPAGTIIGAGIGAIGAIGSWLGAGSKSREARAKMGYIGEQQAGIESALGQLGEVVGMKTEMAGDIYGTNLGQAMFKTGQDLYGLTRQGQTAAARTGFARSEQVETQVGRAKEAGVAAFGFQRQSLQDVLGQKLMDIEEFRGGEEGRLQSEQARLRYEMEEARAQSKKKFLGIF